MTRFAHVMRHDLRVQLRSRMLPAALVNALGFGLMLLALPLTFRRWLLAPTMLAGICTTAFFFAAAILVQDKQTRVLDALRLSPITLVEYLGSKVLTLSALALVECSVLVAMGAHGVQVELPLLLTGIVLCALMYTLAALCTAMPYRALNHFLFPTGVVAATLIQLPILSLFGTAHWAGWALLPTGAAFNMVNSAFWPEQAWPVSLWAVSALSWLGFGLWLCQRRAAAHLPLSWR